MTGRRSWCAVLSVVACAAIGATAAKAAAYRMTVKTLPEAGAKCISTGSGPLVQGMRVFIWDCSSSLSQILDYDDQKQDLKFGTNCVEVVGRGGAGPDIVAVGKCTGSASQRWTMTAMKDNYQVVSGNGLCLEI